MGYCKLVVVVSVLVPFLLKVSKKISSSLTISAVLTKRSSPPLSTFRCTKRMLSQKERIESEVLAWRQAPFCKENNVVIEKAHRKELLG